MRRPAAFASSRGPVLALLERGHALDSLHRSAHLGATARGQWVLVEGEAGVGKSALVEAFAATRPLATPVLWGHCDALFTPRQLGPFLDMAPALGPGLFQNMGTGQPTSALFSHVLVAMGQLPPGSTLVFEDVHWADPTSLDLLKFLARRLVALRLLMVLTCRDEPLRPGQGLAGLLGELPMASGSRIHLQPLSEAAVTCLAQDRGQDGPALYKATGGNPFFVAELLAHAASGPLAQGLPRSVRDAVLARTARLSPAERQLLELLSVAPAPVPLAALLALGGQEAGINCQACLARGLLLQEPDGRLRFRHELARSATLESLDPLQRLRHHQAFVRWLVDQGDAAPADQIVHHAAAVQDHQALLVHAPRAAQQAAHLGAHKQAADFLALALPHAAAATPEQAAQLHQDWAHEAGLYQVTDAVLDAHREAARRWQALNRPEQAGECLRRLWRLHWYRGEVDAAGHTAQAALALLESQAPSPALAKSYAFRAHQSLLKGQRAQARQWGQQAADMAAAVQDTDTQVQALISAATAQLFDGDANGQAPMQQALALATAHHLHEQAARCYTNLAEYAIVTRQWAWAEQLVRDGLAFDTRHALESWTGYLSGRHAQLRLDQGRWAEAAALARGALSVPGRTLTMRLPALTTLATVQSRTDTPGAEAGLQQVLDDALALREPQRITPARLAWVEHHALRGQPEQARQHLSALLANGAQRLRPWDQGAVHVWACRLGLPAPGALPDQVRPEHGLELQGRHEAAAQACDAAGAPFEAALCRLAGAQAGNAAAVDLGQALSALTALGCPSGVQAVRTVAQQHGLRLPAPVRRQGLRGPYGAARNHPLGLTAKEVQVLALMVEGANNADIASRLARSPRTVEHHVSAILAKLNAGSRLEAVLRAVAEPWICQGSAGRG